MMRTRWPLGFGATKGRLNTETSRAQTAGSSAGIRTTIHGLETSNHIGCFCLNAVAEERSRSLRKGRSALLITLTNPQTCAPAQG